nr:odorant receptor 14 [Pachyrhinus yasumatsui]
MWILKTDSILYNSLTLTLRPMQIYGMYPINNVPKWVFYVHAGFLHCILTLPVPLLAYIYLFVNRNSLDLIAIIDLLFMVSEIGITILKYMPIRLYPERVRHSLEWLTLEEFTSYHPDQENIAKSTSEICRKVYIFYATAATSTLLFWCFKPLLLGEKKFPNVIWLPFDPYQSDFLFVLIYIMVMLGTSNACFGNCSLDCITVGLIYHAAGQIKIIKETLRDVVKHAEEKVLNKHGKLNSTDFEAAKNRCIYKEICKCVDRYNLVKEFTKDIEKTYSFTLFSQFTASVVVLCFACIQFFFVQLWTINFFVSVSWTLTMTVEVFLYCYFGSLLYYESSTFVRDIYLTDWMVLDQKCQKAFITIMENSKKPLMIRAGKIIDLSLDTFATIMRRSYSLLAVLNKFGGN